MIVSSLNWKENKKKVIYIIGVCFIVLRFFMTSRLGLDIVEGMHDDLWVVKASANIIKGRWLGDYNQYTLIKGCFTPLLIALSYYLGINYLDFLTILYILSCCVFIYVLKELINNEWIRLICFIVLLFNPLSYSDGTFQRVYRNGLSQWQVLLLFSAIFYIYMHRNDSIKKIVLWEVLAGLIFWSIVNTREDAIWAKVFVAIAIIITIFVIGFNKPSFSDFIIRVLILLIPIYILFCGNVFIKCINYYNYGVFVLNDRTEGSFAKAMGCLYNIKQDPNEESKHSWDEYINILNSTIDLAYDVSPTLNSIRDDIEIVSADNHWIGDDGEYHLDYLMYAIRDGASHAGYYLDAKSAEVFFGKVYEELNSAFECGVLQKRGILISSASVPFEIEQFPRIMSSLASAFRMVVSYDSVSVIECSKDESEANALLFESITGRKSNYDNIASISISGVGFSTEEGSEIDAYICDDKGNILSEIDFQDSEGVYQYFLAQDQDYVNAKKSRFWVNESNAIAKGHYYFEVHNKEDIIFKGMITSDGIVTLKQNESFIFAFDEVELEYGDASLLNKYVAHRVNSVINIYRLLGVIVWFVAAMLYLLLIINCIYKRTIISPELLLFSTATIMTMLLFIGGIAYVDATTYSAVQYSYLSTAYIFNFIFIILSIGGNVDRILKNRWMDKDS